MVKTSSINLNKLALGRFFWLNLASPWGKGGATRAGFAVASTLQMESVVESPFFVVVVVFQGFYGGCVAFPGSGHDRRAALSRRLDEDAQAIPVQLQVRAF